MLLLLQSGLPADRLRRLIERVRELGYEPVLHRDLLGEGCHALLVPEPVGPDHTAMLKLAEGVAKTVEHASAYRRTARSSARPFSSVRLPGGPSLGPGYLCLIAGPCAVEGLDSLLELARELRNAGAALLRGGAFKPRTSPYSFQGLGREGVQILSEVRRKTGMPFVTEVIDPRDVGFVAESADMLQVGSRNQQNFPLLREVGRARKPVLLKRGMSCTLEEFLLAAEYVLEQGNEDVVLCERGVRGFDPAVRNLLDLSAVPALKQLTHLPVIVDPSHGTGRRDLVGPMAKAAVAAGADGVMVEVHQNPGSALSDGMQALLPREFAVLAPALFAHGKLEGRRPACAAGGDEDERVGSAGAIGKP